MKVKKRECIGHVQKRVGYRLRELKKRVKVLGGRGELTKRIIDKLQNYFGIAIRSNVGNLEGMEQSVLASIFHNHIIQLTAQRGLISPINFTLLSPEYRLLMISDILPLYHMDLFVYPI